MKIEKNRIIAEFCDNNMVTIKHETVRGITEKYVTFDDFAKSVMSSARAKKDLESKVSFESPILPNFYVRTVYYREYTTGAYHVILVREPEPADFSLYISRDFSDEPIIKNFSKVGMPRLLFAVKVFQNMIQNVKVCAIKATNITEDTPLYNYPFSNVDGVGTFGGGNICFGSNKMSTINIQNVAGLHSLPNMFLSMPNNHDKYGHNLIECSYSDLLELLEGQPFDNDILEPGDITLKDWIAKLS